MTLPPNPNPNSSVYAEHILAHHKHPRNRVPLKNRTLEHTEDNLSCGDTIALELLIEGKKIAAISWNGSGCAISQGGMSLLSEELMGKPVAKVSALSPKDMRRLLGVPISTRRLKCALLPLLTLRNALRKWNKEPLIIWAELLEEDALPLSKT